MTQRKIALSIEEAADYTGIGRNTLRKLVEWKKLPVLKVGRKVLIKTDMLRRRYLAPLSFSRFKNGCAARVSSGTEKGVRVKASRRRPGYSSVLKVRTAIISFACSRSRMSWSTPK